MPSSLPKNAADSAWSSLFAYAILFLGAVGSVFLAGGPQQAALGVFLVTSGAALLFCPPQRKVEGRLFAVSAVMGLFCAAAFLPQAWFPIPSWRKYLGELAVPLPGSVSTVPSETGFWLVLFTLSAVILLFCLAHPLRSRTLLFFTALAALVTTVYAALAIYSQTSGWKYPFDADPSFGFFPNRNHTAAFLVSGSILALGILGVAWQGRHWLMGAVAVVVFATNTAALLFFSASRGGVIFLILGTLIWLGGLGRSRWSKPLVVSFAGIFIACLVLFFAAKSEGKDRLLALFHLGKPAVSAGHDPVPKGGEEISLDARFLIYRDTWRMLIDYPLTGVGLGAFRFVDGHYRKASLSESASIHPESDWLMLAAEAGIPVLLMAGCGVFLLLRRIGPERDHPYWPLRWGVLSAVLAVLLHGLVDVPLHRLSLGWWILMLAGCGLQRFSKKPGQPPLVQRLVYWIAGLTALALGLFLIRADWFGGPSAPPFAAAKMEDAILVLYKKKQFEKAIDLASAAIARYPMASDLYFQKGVSKLNFTETDAEVDALFAQQRALHPDWPQVSIRQGTAWINIDPARTATLWQDALERRRRIDRAQRDGNRGTLSLFENLLDQSRPFPDLQGRLLANCANDVPLTLLWLEKVGNDLAAGEILRRTQDDSFFRSLSPLDRGRFLRVWYEKGEPNRMFTFLKEHPEWEMEAWPWTIRQLVDARQFQEAITAVETHDQLDLDFDRWLAAAPNVAAAGNSNPVENFLYYWRSGNEITARRILSEAGLTSENNRKIPSAVWRASAILAIHDQRWEPAWNALAHYLKESGVDSLAASR